LTGVHHSSVAWGDHDNDGDLDILLTGDTGSGYISKIYRNDDCQRIYLPLVLRGHESASALAHRPGGETTYKMHDTRVRLAAVMEPGGSASFPAAGMDEEGVLLGACLLMAQALPGRRRGACRRRAPP
jgi:hypothetical protein